MKSNSQIAKKPNLEDFIFLLLVCLFCFVFSNVLLESYDLGCILSSGSFILENLSVYKLDGTLFTEINSFWVNSNWLSDVIFFLAYKIGNYKLLLAFSSILVSALFAILLRQMILKFSNWPVNLTLLTIGILACWDSLEINSKLFSALFLLAYIYLLNSFVEQGFKKKQLIYLLLITVLWANVRSDFIVGIVIIVLYSLSFYFLSLFGCQNKNISIAKKFLMLSAACLLVSLINPYGINEIVMVLKYYISGLQVYNWFLASPDFHIKLPYFFFELFILLFVFLAVFSSYKVPLYKLLSLAFLLIISLYSSVNIVFFVLISLPLLSDIIKNTEELNKIPYYKTFLEYSNLKITPFSVFYPILFIIIVVISVYFVPDMDKKLANNAIMPVKAVKFIKENNLQGRMFNPLGWGCYLSNELSCKVFIHERMYKINKQTLLDYSEIVNIYSEFFDVFRKYNIEWIIVPDTFVLNQFLEESKIWKVLYKDNKSIIFIKNSSKEKI